MATSGSTMTGQLVSTHDGTNIEKICHGVAKGSTPSSSDNKNICWTDSTQETGNAGQLARMGHAINTSGHSVISMYAVKNEANSDSVSGFFADADAGTVSAVVNGTFYPILHSNNYPNYCVATSGGTMTGALEYNNGGNSSAALIIRHNATRGSAPASAQSKFIQFMGRDDETASGSVFHSVATTGINVTELRAMSQMGDGYSSLRIQQGSNGKGAPYFYQGADSTLGVAAAGPYELWHKGNLSLTTFSPTSASAMGTLNRRFFARLGPIVFFQFVFTNSSTISSNTNIFTGLPAAVQTSDAPLIQYGGTANREIYINSSGQMKVSGSISTGNWVANGWYYTSA